MAEGLDEFPFGPIARDLRDGNCIPFLGAGASSFPKDIEAKPPSARALAMELAEEWNYPQYRSFVMWRIRMIRWIRNAACAQDWTVKILCRSVRGSSTALVTDPASTKNSAAV
jgi:hypothetical protein